MIIGRTGHEPRVRGVESKGQAGGGGGGSNFILSSFLSFFFLLEDVGERKSEVGMFRETATDIGIYFLCLIAVLFCFDYFFYVGLFFLNPFVEFSFGFYFTTVGRK